MDQQPELSEEAMKQHTGAVGLFVSGEQPELMTGREVLAAAEQTQFFDEGRVERKSKSGTIAYLPRTFVPNAIREALAQGLLLYKFIVDGTPPEGPQLDPGTYYFMLDFVETPHMRKEARWLGRIFDDGGTLACLVPGVEVKEVLAYGMDHGELHSRPRITPHGVAARRYGGRLAADSGWVDVQISWEPFGAGCWTQTVCVPGT